jgi:hypothetical protein
MSILLAEEFNGITNDLIAINESTVFLTESLSFPDPIDGRLNASLWQKLIT